MTKQEIKGKETAPAKKRSQARDTWRRFRNNKLAMVGLVIVLVIVLSAVFADLIAPYDYDKQSYEDRFLLPCVEHPFGTDNYGRDLLSRIIFGGRISLLVSLLGLVISLAIGAVLGATAGYFGGAYETTIMRLMDILMAIPPTLLAVSVSALLGSGVFNTALAVAISGVAPSSRMLRATVLSIREQEFVEAARARGSGHLRIIFRQILPNTLSPLIVDSTLRIGGNHHDDLGVELHRPGRAASDAGMGLHPEYRPRIHHDVLAHDHVPGPGHHADDVRFQCDGGRAERRAGSEAQAIRGGRT